MGYGSGMSARVKKMRKLAHRLRSDSVWDAICEAVQVRIGGG